MGRRKKNKGRATQLRSDGAGGITVISGVQEPYFFPTEQSVAEDVEMVRAALLYTDKITLYSVGASVFMQLRQLTKLDTSEQGLLLLQIMAQSEFFGEEQRRIVEDLITAQRLIDEKLSKASRAQRRRDRQFDDLMASKADIRRNLARLTGPLKLQFKELWGRYGGGELIEAMDAGLLEVKINWFDDALQAPEQDQNDLLTDAFIGAIAASRGGLMFDRWASGMVLAMQQEGIHKLRAFEHDAVRTTRTGTRMIENLPQFPGTNVNDLLEARQEIKAPLNVYQRSVAALAERLREDPLSDDLRDEIDYLWESEVLESVTDLREAVYDSKLHRRWQAGKSALGRAVGWAGASGMSIGVSNLIDLDLLQIGGVDVGGMLAPSALGAAAFKAGGAGWRESIQAARKREEAARADGLFYLVDVGNSLHRPR